MALQESLFISHAGEFEYFTCRRVCIFCIYILHFIMIWFAIKPSVLVYTNLFQFD